MSFLQEATVSNETAATLYASIRVKVVVRGTPVLFDAEKYPATDTSQALYKSPSTGLFEVYKPDDNRTFPHREISIDIYSMNLGFEDLLEGVPNDYCSWDLIASNDPQYEGDENIV